ncbi:MAG: hypothetical protein ACOCX4_03670 [Planctomycetota bacterium]
MLTLATLLAFVLPAGRIGGVWGTGFSGCNSAMFANFARSYHRAPPAIGSYLPALWRAPGAPAAEKDLYASQFPYIYLACAAATAVAGTSEAALRLLAVAITLAGAFLVARLAGREDPWTGVAAAFLYLTAPVTLLYGDMAEIILPQGLCLALAVWAYGRRADGRMGTGRYVLACVPLALSSSFLFPFYAAGVFAVDLALHRSLRRTVPLLAAASLPWAGLLALHLGIVHHVYGDLDIFFGRAGERGLRPDRFWGDLGEVGRAWGERLGAPQLVLLLAGLVLAVRRGGAARATAAATGAIILFTTAGLMGWFVVHRYGMQLWIPLAAVLGGPVLAGLVRRAILRRAIVPAGDGGRGRWAVRAAAGILVLACVGLFAHRIRRHEGPNAYETALARLAALAGAHAPGDERPLLLVVRKNVMGARMSVLYYAHRPDYRILATELDRVVPTAHPAVLGLDVLETLPVLQGRYGIARDGVEVRLPVDADGDPLGTLYLWRNPAAGAHGD